jgi:hypothetical protein
MLAVNLSGFVPTGTGTGVGEWQWLQISGEPALCPVIRDPPQPFGFVLSGDPFGPSEQPANVVQITDDMANYECTLQ